MHTLLQRQIRRHLGQLHAPPSPEHWQAFLAAVSDAYEQFDRDRQLLERSLELSAQDVLEANSKLRAAFDAFPDVLLRLDASGKVIDYTVGRTTQLPLRDQVLGKPLRDVLRLEEAAAIEEALRAVQQTKQVVSVESSLPRASGASAYEARVAPLLDDQAIVVIRDISERRRAEEELRARARQQEAVAALGHRGLTATDLSGLLHEAVSLIAATLGADHCTVWELKPDGHTLTVRAGVGWSEGRARQTRLDVRTWEPATARSYLSGEPLVVEDYRTDTRFGGAPLAREHGVMSGTMVLIQGRERPFGALSAHFNRSRDFTRNDVHFLQAAAHVLAAAVERRRTEHELQQATRAAEERTRELSALLEISGVVSSTLELRPLLSLVLDRLKAAIDYSAATITIFHGDTPVILDYRGPLPRQRLLGARLPRGSQAAELIQEIVRRGGPLITDLEGESVLTRHLAAEGVPVAAQVPVHARSQMGVPLIAQDTVIGTLGVVHETPGFYTERHAQLAMGFAQQAAVAIENARLYEAARDRATLAERQRLARELHDSVSQALYGIALNASAAAELFDARPERARGLVQDVLRLAETGLAEMRALIFELRPESLEQEGLVGALEKQAVAVQARHGLQMRLSLGSEPAVPAPTKEALYRVAQEALHNAAKHARARTLDLVLDVGQGGVELRVADDGRGFDPHAAFPGHLGLCSMRERAAAVGGTLEIESAPGAGTRLSMRVPVPVAAHP